MKPTMPMGGFPEPERRDERSTWLWVAVGCGAIALSALCIVPPALWLVLSDDDEPVVADVDPVRPPDPVPAPPIAPSPSLPPLPSPSLPSPSLPPPPASAGPPRRVTAIVEEVTGSIATRAGATCAFDVVRHDQADGTFWCNAQIRCGAELLYGGQNAGFFDCTLYEQPQRHVVGEDPLTTSGDRDAAMRLDTLRGTLVVRDDAAGRLGVFTLRARVTQVQ
jgi:hypothetical protein